MKRRWVVLLAAVVMQTCMGGVYAWSVFVESLRSAHGFSAAQGQFVFGATIASFTVAMVLAGRRLPRWGARRTGSLGAILFALGYLLAFAGGGGFGPVFAGIGLMSGAGIGFGYVSALTSGMRWFPHHRGLATGCSVAGFGSGAVLLSAGASHFLESGMAVPHIFGWIGALYGLVILCGAMLLFRPPQEATAAPALAHDGALLRDRRFRLLALGLFAGTFAGLLVVGNLEPIGVSLGVSARVALVSISVLAVGNAVGRLIWGWIADRVGFAAVPLSLLLLLVGIVGLASTAALPYLYLFCSFLVGAGFGACFVVYAAEVAHLFGSDGVARIYPLLFLFYGVSGILGPPAGGALFDWMGHFGAGLALSLGLLAVACAITGIRRKTMREPVPVL